MVHIIQLLCPQRHCITGLAYDSATYQGHALADFAAAMNEAFQNGVLNRWCGICRSRELHYEDNKTIFHTIDEAKPFLLELEKQQSVTRAILGEQARN